MYFWNIEGLKSKLTAALLTDREVLPYFIVFLVLMMGLEFLPPEKMNLWDYLTTAYAILISIFGTLYLYRKNGGSAGVHFIQCYMAVGWVVGVRWMALVLPLFFVFRIATDLPTESNVGVFTYNAELYWFSIKG